MEARAFAELMGGLIACTAHKMSTRDVEIWRRHLSDFSDEALRVAFDRACAECKAFPSVALIREFAAQATHGTLPSHGEVFDRVMKAVRRYGACANCEPHCGEKCREKIAEAFIGPVGWRAVRSLGGWRAVCDSDPNQRGTLRAQFRTNYETLAARETQLRALPEHARPKIEGHSQPVSLPLRSEEGRKLLEHVAFKDPESKSA